MNRTNLDDKAKLKLYIFKLFHYLLTCGLLYVVWLLFRYGDFPQGMDRGFRYNYLVTAGFARGVRELVQADQKIGVQVVGQTYKLRDDLDTYLLIGLDKFSDTPGESGLSTNHQQADFLFLIVVDHSEKSYSAIHLNRDAMTEIQRLGMSGKKIGTFTGQLALAHTYGSGGRDSCRNTAQAVSHYLKDVPVDHYFSLTMDAIPLINDLAGGVVVHIDDDFSAIDPTLVQGKDVRLWGQHALTFVRARHYVDDSSNLSRMNRQRAYLYGLHDQLVEKLGEDSKFGARLISRLADFKVSDLTSDEMLNLAEKVKDYRFTGIRSIPGEAVLGEKYMEFYTDDAALQELVMEIFFQSSVR